jgi:HEAT repeat protein
MSGFDAEQGSNAAGTVVPGAPAVDDLIARLKSADPKVRGPAWQGAGPCGAPAVRPLAGLMGDADFEIARAARRALWQIVRHAGRPGAKTESAAVIAELVALLSSAPAPVRREAAAMLSEIGGNESVTPLAAMLADPELREAARCALQRLPGSCPLAALETGLRQAPDDFKEALADSLRKRGKKVKGYPSRNLTPSRQTAIGH